MWSAEGYCRWGRRSKARTLREKNPFWSHERSVDLELPTSGKAPFRLTYRVLDTAAKMECAVLTQSERISILDCRWRAISGYFPLIECGCSRSGRGFGGRSVPGFWGYPQMWMWLWKLLEQIADCGGWVGAFCYSF
jgi:hypothetical protein